MTDIPRSVDIVSKEHDPKVLDTAPALQSQEQCRVIAEERALSAIV